MSEDIKTLLERSDKGLAMAKNAPAKLLRSIFLDRKIKLITWDKLMRNYLISPRSGIANNPAKRSSERSNFNRAIANSSMSWKQLSKAVTILAPDNATIELDLNWDERLVLSVTPPTQIIYEIQGRRNELSGIFQVLLTKMNILPSLWSILIERYLNDPRNNISDNPAERSTVRGNLDKMLKFNSFTWNAFYKALNFLGVVSATFTIILDYEKSGKKSSRHSYTFRTGKE